MKVPFLANACRSGCNALRWGVQCIASEKAKSFLLVGYKHPT